MGRELIIGPIMRYMRASGCRGRSMALAYGSVRMGHPIWANGRTIKSTVTVSTSGKTATNMKGNGRSL